MPRDIDPDCNQLENVYVYNIDDLQTIAGQYLEQRKAELAHCEKLIAEKRDELLDGLKSRPDRTQLGFAKNRAAEHFNNPCFDTNNIVIATRGSALALAQANMIFDQCRKAFQN